MQVKTRPSRTVTEGDRIGSLEVVHAFGHTPGQIALLDTRDRSLYCADAYSTLGGVATFGLNGVIIGPVIAAMFLAIWNLFDSTVPAQTGGP